MKQFKLTANGQIGQLINLNYSPEWNLNTYTIDMDQEGTRKI